MKTNYLLSLITFFFAGMQCAGCATFIQSPLTGPEDDELRQSIKANDSDKFASLLKNKSFLKKESVSEGIGRISNPQSGDVYNSKIRYSYSIYDLVTKNETGESRALDFGFCRPKMIEALIAANLLPRNVDLENSLYSPCTSAVDIIVANMSPKDFESAAAQIAKSFEGIVGRVNDPDYTNPRELNFKAAVVPGLKVVADRAKMICSMKNGGLPNPECDLSSQLTAFIEGISAEVARFQEAQKSQQLAVSKVESQSGKKFCKSAELYNVLYSPFLPPIEQGCICVLRGPLSAFQSTADGVLVRSAGNFDKIFYLVTPNRYIDGASIGDSLVVAEGATQYTTVLGALRTINKFRFLGAAKASSR